MMHRRDIDDRGDGNVGLEFRREDVVGGQWTGLRGIAALPLGRGFRYSTEVEIVVPDQVGEADQADRRSAEAMAGTSLEPSAYIRAT